MYVCTYVCIYIHTYTLKHTSFLNDNFKLKHNYYTYTYLCTIYIIARMLISGQTTYILYKYSTY